MRNGNDDSAESIKIPFTPSHSGLFEAHQAPKFKSSED
jgi:hypothetical protein